MKFYEVFSYIKSKFSDRNLYGKKTPKNKKIAILNFSYSQTNFGAVLLAYAMENTFKKLGYEATNITYNPHGFSMLKTIWFTLPAFYKFTIFKYEFLNTTRPFWNGEKLSQLNKDFDTFVFGSDQIWRYAYFHKFYRSYFGAFADNSKKLISYAASFGKDKWDEAPEDITKEIKKLLERFSAISVREDSGVDICKNIFWLEATHVIDPTLLLDAEDYAPIHKNCKLQLPSKPYLAYALFDTNDEIQKDLEDFAKNFNLLPKYINAVYFSFFGKRKRIYNSPAEWLLYIKNCDFFITDSFHSVAFAIIHKKQFACTMNKSRGNARFESIARQLGLEDRMVTSVKEAKALYNTPIDYDKVYEKLNFARKTAIDFLKIALEK